MRVAFVVEVFPALSETFILNQITGLIDRGHEVDIYANTSRNEFKLHADVEKYDLLRRTYYFQIPNNKRLRLLKGLKLIFLNCWKDPAVLLRSLNVFKYGQQAASLKLLYTAIPFLGKRPSYDVIQCHFGWNGLQSVFLRDIGAIKGKVVTTFHGVDITQILRMLGTRVYDPLFDKGDLFLPISECWKRRLIDLGCNEKKVVVHRMGVDCKKFTFTPRRLHPNRPIRVVTISRLVEKKGVEYGIRAVAKLAKANQNIEYNIVGDGDLREHLERLIQELNVAGVVKLLGWKQQQEIIEILSNSNVLLAPSVTSKHGDQEGIPVALMEVMAMGLPVLSTRHSGIPELIEDGVSGFLVSERDVDALAERLSYLVEHPEIWPAMGQAGHVFVKEHYDINKLNDRLVELYQKLLNVDLPLGQGTAKILSRKN